ncbi:hypothetical protein HZA71_00315 [Candidatus Falkowbacteria bacterium]|nr:hypothetical protein [Candidatus Falkowbacteria bacterium]
MKNLIKLAQNNQLFLKKCACFLFLLILLSVPVLAKAATDNTNILENLNKTGLGTGKGDDLKVIIGAIVKVFLGFMGIVMVILIIYSGFLWMTAAGDEKKVEKAKEILKNAVIGIIIILIAYSITAFVITKTQTAIQGQTTTR